MKKILSLCLFIFSGTCLSAPWSYSFPVSTDIDINKFYNHDVTSLLLKDSAMTAVFDRNSSAFHDLNTTLTVGTNIPISNNVYQHNIRMIDKKNACFDDKNNQVLTPKQQDDLNALYVSGVLLPLNVETPLGGFTDAANGFKAQSHTLSIYFSPIDPTVIRRCEGSVLLSVSLDI